MNASVGRLPGQQLLSLALATFGPNFPNRERPVSNREKTGLAGGGTVAPVRDVKDLTNQYQNSAAP